MNNFFYLIMFFCFLYVGPVKAQHYDGMASYYGPGFHGRKAANGSIFDMHSMTCAHKKYPFGTKLKVTNMKNGKSVVVTVTDRGPYARGRVIDLSLGAAKEIDMMKSGVVPVSIEIVNNDDELAKNDEPESLNDEKPARFEELKVRNEKIEVKGIKGFGEFKKPEFKFEFPKLALGHQAS